MPLFGVQQLETYQKWQQHPLMTEEVKGLPPVILDKAFEMCSTKHQAMEADRSQLQPKPSIRMSSTQVSNRSTEFSPDDFKMLGAGPLARGLQQLLGVRALARSLQHSHEHNIPFVRKRNHSLDHGDRASMQLCRIGIIVARAGLLALPRWTAHLQPSSY